MVVGSGVEEFKDRLKFSYLQIWLWNVHDDDESGNGGDESKDDDKKINNVVPRRTTKEHFWSKNNYPQDDLVK